MKPSGLNKGYIQIYTGDGKGKTSAALGLAFRAVGRDLKVFMVQFMKAPDSSGEHISAKLLGDRIIIKPCGVPGFIFERGVQPEDRAMAMDALNMAREAMISGQYQLIILDEINVAVEMTLIEVGDLLAFLKEKPDGLELVLTGRNAAAAVVEAADLVSEIKAVKHYFQDGVPAREGIEF